MNKFKIIRPISALVLLLLFILSNAPKQLMHDLFANHVDYKKVLVEKTDISYLNQLSYHCQCEHFVVESPFTRVFYTAGYYSPLNYRQFISRSYTHISSHHQFQPGLRGPPVV